MSIDVKYRTAATATGGRDGRTRTEDGKLDFQLAIPKEIGGPGGDGVNPEELFAAGYAACFLSSVKGAGQKLKVRVSPEATVKAIVGIGKILKAVTDSLSNWRLVCQRSIQRRLNK
jgi:Ohr subfamily peroxiredoxin